MAVGCDGEISWGHRQFEVGQDGMRHRYQLRVTAPDTLGGTSRSAGEVDQRKVVDVGVIPRCGNADT